jgi:hypothetical protein
MRAFIGLLELVNLRQGKTNTVCVLININHINEFIFYLTEDTLHLHYKDRSVDVVSDT